MDGPPSKFASAAAATFASNVGAATLGLVNVLVVARVLGAEGRGHVAFLTTVAGITGALATLGIEQANANFAGAEPASRRPLATNSLLYAAAFGGLAVAVIAGLVEVFPGIGADSEARLRWLALGGVPLIVLGTYLTLLAQADYRFSLANAAWVLPAVVQLVVNAVLALEGDLTVGTAVGAWVGGQLLATALLVAAVAHRPGFGEADLRLARRALAFGARSHLGRVLTLGNYRLDQWFVGTLAGARELGLYSVAVAWSEVLFFLPTAISAVQRPDLVRAEAATAGKLAAAAARIALVVTAAAAVAVAVAAPLLCLVVFGEDFRGSIDDLRVLAFGALGMACLKVLGNALTARGRPLLTTAAVAIAFAVTLVLDVVLIPPFGGLGAAIASTAAYTAGGIAVLILFVRALGVGPRDLVPRREDAVRLGRDLRARLL